MLGKHKWYVAPLWLRITMETISLASLTQGCLETSRTNVLNLAFSDWYTDVVFGNDIRRLHESVEITFSGSEPPFSLETISGQNQTAITFSAPCSRSLIGHDDILRKMLFTPGYHRTIDNNLQSANPCCWESVPNPTTSSRLMVKGWIISRIYILSFSHVKMK